MGGNVMMAFARFRIFLLGLALTGAGVLLSLPADAQVYNRFGPANGILKGDTSTYITTQALSADVISLWTGTCNSTTFMRADGSCQVPAGTGVTSVGLTVPSGLSVTGSPVTSSGTLGITTTLNGLIHGNGSGFTAGTAAVADGGTGAVTLSGVLKGNTTSPVTSAASADVTALWSGTCNNTTFLRGDGTCAAGAGGSGANPTATIGLTAVNGVAASFIRSDGAPPLSQAIAPTWTAQHIFGLSTSATATPSLSLQSNFPVLEWSELDGSTNNKNWQESVNGEQLLFRAVNDARNTATDWMTVDRTANVIDGVTFPATGQVTIGAGPFNPTGVGTSTNALVINGIPRMYFNEAAAAANNRLWRFFANGSQFFLTATLDDISAENYVFRATRSGTTISALSIQATQADVVGQLSVNGQSVLRTPSGGGKTVFAKVSGTGGCSFGTNQSGFSACTRNTNGNYSLTVSGSNLTNNAACVASVSTTGPGGPFYATADGSSTQVNILTYNSAGTLTDSTFQVICIGPP